MPRSRRVRPLRALAALVLATAPALPGAGAAPTAAQAPEREEIVAYDVTVQLADGGVMTVTESIEVRALGDRIRRGIFRDLPTAFPRLAGLGTVVAPLEVVRVERDGAAEPYRIETVAGPGKRSGVRVRVGDADVLLDPGIHRYTLVYRTERWMRFGDTRDTLTWNVTGNGWDFDIGRASARIVVPGAPPADAVDTEAWTGPEGSTARDAGVAYDAAAGVATFTTDGALAPGEGLTVRVTLPSGTVAPPSEEQAQRWRALDWGGYLEALLVALVVLAVYLALWIRVGRDPDRSPLMVRYEPPPGFSPAALGYLQERTFGSSLLTATMVHLGVTGAADLERSDDEWRVTATGTVPEELAPEERTFLKELSRNGTLTLSGTTNSRLRSATSILRTRLQGSLAGRYFVLNRRWFGAGLAASVVAFALLALRYRYQVAPEAWFLGIWLTLWTAGTAALVVQVARLWWAVLRGEWVALVAALVATLFSLPFIGAELFVAWMLYRGVPGHLVVAAVAVGALNVLFFHLLERPTLEGRGVLDHLRGFRRFLEGTEADRFDRLQDPDRPLELFERYLPHAIALGVENRWASRFESVLDRAGRAEADGRGGSFAPAWVSGTGDFGSAAGLSRSLGSSFASTLSSSSAAPSSSSGGSSSGGSSSGGGGGGGGGGGW